MRARDVMLFIICVGVSAQIVSMMGVFPETIQGSSVAGLTYTELALAIGLLVGGGTTVLSFNFKIPAVLTVYAAMYAGSVAMMQTLLAQMIHPLEMQLTITGFFLTLTGIIGVLGALEISGGPHGGME